MQRTYFFVACLPVLAAGLFAVGFSREFRAAFGEATEARAREKVLAAHVAEVLAQERTFTLVFAGDIMLSRAVGKKIETENDPRYPFLKIAETLRSADLAFGNLEGPISSRGRNQGSIYSFRADPRVIDGLTFAGFDVLSVANNHIFDWGSDALADTLGILKENGITPVGAGENFEEANAPVIKAIGKTRFAFLAYTTLYPKSLEAMGGSAGVSSFELGRVENEIAALKTSGVADVVIISLHWGEEYKPQASEEQKEVAHALVDAGADVIVGHHPHVAEEVEHYNGRYNGGWIAYSLGNFVFDQSFSKETMEGLLLEVRIRGGEIVEVAPRNVIISLAFQPAIQ